MRNEALTLFTQIRRISDFNAAQATARVGETPLLGSGKSSDHKSLECYPVSSRRGRIKHAEPIFIQHAFLFQEWRTPSILRCHTGG